MWANKDNLLVHSDDDDDDDDDGDVGDDDGLAEGYAKLKMRK